MRLMREKEYFSINIIQRRREKNKGKINERKKGEGKAGRTRKNIKNGNLRKIIGYLFYNNQALS